MFKRQRNNLNVWNKWGRLRKILLGRCFPNDFFSSIEDEELREILTKILTETNEDLDNFEKILIENGVEVIRTPNMYNSLKELKKAGVDITKSPTAIPPPPMCPRDQFVIVGKKAVGFRQDIWPDNYNFYEHFRNVLLELVDEKDIIDVNLNNFQAPQATLVGKDFYMDAFPMKEKNLCHEKFKKDLLKAKNLIQKQFPELRINTLGIGAHGDGCFHTLKPGKIISLCDIQNYSNTFPGWDICYLQEESWDKVKPFMDLKKKNKGKWWIEGEEYNDKLIMFIETWLQDWVGYVEESVFDVNVVMLDENNMFVSSVNNSLINRFAEENDINLIHIPWRHRYFWDGGLHCITLDLIRDGVIEDYFPERKQPVIDEYFYE